MPSDPALYALALENNRLLKALTENWAKARATDTGKPMLVRDGVACGCIGSHTPTCNSREESHCTVLDCVLPAGHRDPHCGKNGLELKVTRGPDAKQPDSSMESEERSRGYSPPTPFIDSMARPLTEPDMQHVLKTGSLPDISGVKARLDELVPECRRQIHDAGWSLACRDAAARINAALGYQTQNPDLEESLAVLRNKARFGVLAGSPIALIQSSIRDAALEEVERIATSMSLRNRDASDTADSSDMRVTYRTRAAAFQEMALECRALKSKPAPVDLHLSAKDEEEILASGGGFSHVSGKTTQAGPAPQPSDDPGELPKDCIEGRRTYQQCHEGLCSHLVVHDFGWALAQMRAGKKVRRKAWGSSSGPVSYAGLCNAVPVDPKELVATDWEVVE